MWLLEKALTGIFLGVVLGVGYYGTIYAIEWLRVTRLKRNLKK
jgi:hypothetical protein